ncbi:putative RNA recognition motif domain, nucleotide-binding alpha-beta plait domain superfamily [Arabidopsis thaliana]
MDRRLKKCSTSTDVESVHDVSKVTDPLQKAKRELDNVEIKEKQKKKKNQNETSEKETKKFSTVYEKFNDTIKELDRVSGTWPIRPAIPFTPPKEKVEPIYHNECNFDDKAHLGVSDSALFVQGFDTSHPRHEIKTALWNHFSSCGKVYLIYVPIACSTGASVGYAFIDMKNETKGLTLNGSHLGGRKIDVMFAIDREEFYFSSNLKHCQRCRNYRPWLVLKAMSDACFEYHQRIKPRIVGTPHSKIGRFTAIIGRRSYS